MRDIDAQKDRIEAKLVAPLQRDGHRCWLVGGYVRDWLRGGAPHDLDVATDAEPEALNAWLRRADLRQVANAAGLMHGTFKVFVPGLQAPVDIACLRRDVERLGRRHARVVFTKNLTEDLARRDFTINAMALTWSPGDEVIDPFGGQADLTAKRVRFVGDAAARIHEDPLRLLRMARMTALGPGWTAVVTPEVARQEATWRAALATVSAERVRDELIQAMALPAPANFWRTAGALGIAQTFVAPLCPTGDGAATSELVAAAVAAGCRALDGLTVASTDPGVRLAAMALGIVDGFDAARGPQPTHLDRRLAAIGRVWAQALHLCQALARDVVHLVGHALGPYAAQTAAQEQNDDAALMAYLSSLAQCRWSPQAALALIARLQAARGAPHDRRLARLQELLAEGRPLSLADLAIDGHDLIGWGTPAGPQVARLLEACLRHVQLSPQDNTRAGLRAHAAAMGRLP